MSAIVYIATKVQWTPANCLFSFKSRFLRLFGVCLSLFAVHVSTVAQTPLERTQFASLDGLALVAWLQRAPGDAARPTVIALHGCGGLYAQGSNADAPRLNARHAAMGELLVGQGYHVLWVDSLTPRGERELCTQKMGERKIDQTQRRADALGALDWVSAQPWTAGQGVALLGWSHGGSAVLAATDSQNRIAARPSTAPKFKVALAFYPGCGASLRSGARPNTRLELFLGGADDWTPPEPCIEWAAKVSAKAHVYPGAFHDFDNPAGRLRVRTEVPNGVRPGGGVTVGPDPQARELAYARLLEVLSEELSKK
jgi:dienelactone hydrolase